MPSWFSSSKNKNTVTDCSSQYRYSAIGSSQIRLLRYAPLSKPNDLQLEIQTFDRRTSPPYIAVSYLWGVTSPMHRVRLNGNAFEVRPNLCNALRCMRNGLQGWFWIDAICIDQLNTPERNEQVRQMSSTYKNAAHVASWIGLCDERLRLAFMLDVRRCIAANLPRDEQKRLQTALQYLDELQYWKRIWIQQELLLNPNIVLFASELSQPLHPLIHWTDTQGLALRVTLSVSLAVEWAQWRQAPVLRLLTWAGHNKMESTDARDKMFALLTLVVEHERVALQRYFPDYDLTLAQVVMVTLVHIRRFAGQKRAAQQLDSVLVCFGEMGDSACAEVVRSYYLGLKNRSAERNGQVNMRLSARERAKLKSRRLLKGEMDMLDVCDCIFAEELGPSHSGQVDVRASRSWSRPETWVLDLPLSRELNVYWSDSYAKP